MYQGSLFKLLSATTPGTMSFAGARAHLLFRLHIGSNTAHNSAWMGRKVKQSIGC